MRQPSEADRVAAEQLLQQSFVPIDISPAFRDPGKGTYGGIAIDEIHRWAMSSDDVQRYLKQLDANFISISGSMIC